MAEDWKAKALEMRHAGAKVRTIARMLHKHTDDVSNWLRENDAFGDVFLTDAEKTHALRLRRDGYNIKEIAVRLGRSPAGVRKTLLKAGGLNKRRVREIRVEGDIAIIPLTRGREAIIDVADLSLVTGSNWFTTGVDTNPYAAAKIGQKGKVVALHRLLMSPSPEMHVDHINGNGLDNRRSNLRLATPHQNAVNGRRKRRGADGYIGVQKRKHGRYYSTINLHLGTYDTAEEAARAYDAKAIELFGEFAVTNASKGLLPTTPEGDHEPCH